MKCFPFSSKFVTIKKNPVVYNYDVYTFKKLCQSQKNNQKDEPKIKMQFLFFKEWSQVPQHRNHLHGYNTSTSIYHAGMINLTFGDLSG